MLPDWLTNKKIGIFGYGVNNAALTQWLLDHGVEDLVVYDEDPEVEARANQADLTVEVITGDDAFSGADDRDVIFRTPGLHVNHPALQAARERGARITSQTDLFLELCSAKTVGITGTKGKGTVASLLHHLLQGGSRDSLNSGSIDIDSAAQNDAKSLSKVKGQRSKVFLAGNIGKDPFEFLDKLQRNDIVILELSSGQLQDVSQSPGLAIVLDVTTDHMDYHKTVGEYVDAKRNIVKYQHPGDIALLNLDSEMVSSFALDAGGTVMYYSPTKSVDAGGFLLDGVVQYRDPRSPASITSVSLEHLPLPGPHNQFNALVAVTAVLMLGAGDSDIEQRLGSYQAMPHRLETIVTSSGVTWVNDSYATIPEATAAAVQSFEKPIILITGGYDKGLEWSELGKALARANLKRVLTIGQTGPTIGASAVEAGLAQDRVESLEALDKAVIRASEIAEDGDVVVLSPASASFDQFKNVSDRGDTFKKLVKQLIQPLQNRTQKDTE